MMKPFLAFLAAAASTQSAMAAEPPQPAEAAIPFVRSDGIMEWKAVDESGLFIQSMSGDWYFARTMARCPRLLDALTIGFETRGPDQLDRHGTLLVQGWRCALASVTRSSPPPRRRS
jgi:hypothetical protein